MFDRHKMLAEKRGKGELVRQVRSVKYIWSIYIYIYIHIYIYIYMYVYIYINATSVM
jgi:hypothetical protein